MSADSLGPPAQELVPARFLPRDILDEAHKITFPPRRVADDRRNLLAAERSNRLQAALATDEFVADSIFVGFAPGNGDRLLEANGFDVVDDHPEGDLVA